MPIGSYSAMADIVCELIHQNPKSILDLGIGFGMNGAAVRNWLGNGVSSPHLRIVGVETWKDYKSPLWGCYDLVRTCTIQDYFTEGTETFDAILMTDVIEHFDKEEGKQVINDALQLLNPNGVLYVSTPGIWSPQGAVHGNEMERHLSEWKVGDFLPCRIIRNGYQQDHYGHQMVVIALHKHTA